MDILKSFIFVLETAICDNSMDDAKKLDNDLFLYANYYHNLGMNLSPIKATEDNYKEPLDASWDVFCKNKQHLQYIQTDVWKTATGIGCVLGYNGYRALDIDGLLPREINLLGEKVNREENVRRFVLECLNILCLPSDYKWIVNSGSGVGLHIIFRTENTIISDPVYAYSPAKRYRDMSDGGTLFSLIEFRCNAFLVLPPSIHDANNRRYSFYYNNEIPTYRPYVVDISNVRKLLNYFCADTTYINCSYQDYNLPVVRTTRAIEKRVSFSYELTKTEDDIELLKQCREPDAYNTLGVMYLLGKNGLKADVRKAEDYFLKAKNEMSRFNLASLRACGILSGNVSPDSISYDLKHCPSIKDDKIQQVKKNFSTFQQKIDKQREEEEKEAKAMGVAKPFFLFYDTETLGLPVRYDASYTDSKNWPRLIQLSWILMDRNGKPVKTKNRIVYPDNFEIPSSISELTGITTEVAIKEGVQLSLVMEDFLEDVRLASYLVGHNESFDRMVLCAELHRLGLTSQIPYFMNMMCHCTMKESASYCKITTPNGWDYKYPTLQELYSKLFNTSFDNAHDALADVTATAKCFWELVNRKIIPLGDS